MDERQTFRSPMAVIIWWVWLLFAVANLIDIAVQGRDHLSVVAAFILVLITGVVYVAAQRPRIITDDDGLTVINPLRDHRIGWAAVSSVDASDLVRLRCEWPLADGGNQSGQTGQPERLDQPERIDQPERLDQPEQADLPRTGKRVIYSWAIQSTRRRQLSTQLRAERNRVRPRRTVGPPPAFGAPEGSAGQPATVGDSEHVVAELSARVERAHTDKAGERARPPVSTWYWPALAAILIPALALVIAILA